jgi:hypothetical protein
VHTSVFLCEHGCNALLTNFVWIYTFEVQHINWKMNLLKSLNYFVLSWSAVHWTESHYKWNASNTSGSKNLACTSTIYYHKITSIYQIAEYISVQHINSLQGDLNSIIKFICFSPILSSTGFIKLFGKNVHRVNKDKLT